MSRQRLRDISRLSCACSFRDRRMSRCDAGESVVPVIGAVSLSRLNVPKDQTHIDPRAFVARSSRRPKVCWPQDGIEHLVRASIESLAAVSMRCPN